MSTPYQVFLPSAIPALRAAFVLKTAGPYTRAVFALSVTLTAGALAAVTLIDDHRNAKLSSQNYFFKIDTSARTSRTSVAVRQVRETTGADIKHAYRYVRRATGSS